MTAKQKRDSLLDAVRTRFVGYIKEGRSASEIAEREGFEDDYTERLRRKIAKEEGLTLSKARLDPNPYGMTEESRTLRRNLGNLVFRLRENDKLHELEVAKLIGVSQKAQKKTWEKKNQYDWSISQLERLAHHKGMTFHDFMMEVLTKNAAT